MTESGLGLPDSALLSLYRDPETLFFFRVADGTRGGAFTLSRVDSNRGKRVHPDKS